jgi:tubulin-like protein
MSRNIEFHPALVIGLGGTGQGILLRLKKRFIDQFGDVPVVQFLAIDTTQEAKRQDTSSDGYTDVELKPNDEQFIYAVRGASNLLRGKNPHINEWWPTGTRVQAINSGSRQIRALGRLALFANYTDIKRHIKDKLDEVRRIENKNRMQDKGYVVSDRRGVDVYIVTSLAGGTGSGMMMDIAFITRNIVPSSGITGIFVLSGIFDNLPGTDLVRTNTYAALKEIEWLSKLRENEMLEVDYGINKIVVSEPPFDMIYIADNMNESETVIKNYKTLHSQIADGIFLMIGSEIGVSSGNRFNNVKEQVANLGLIENRSTGYCSFGVSSCTWKVREFRAKVAASKNASAQRLIKDLLGSFADNETLQADLLTLTHQSSIGAEDLLKQIGLPEGKKAPDTFAEKRDLMRHRENALNVLRAEYPSHSNKVNNYAAENARANCERLKGTFLSNLSGHRDKSLSRTDFLSYLSSFLRQLGQAIDSTKQELERRGKNAEIEAQAINLGEVTQSRGGTLRVLRGLLSPILTFFRPRSAVVDLPTVYANKVDQHCKWSMKVTYCAEGIRLLTEMQTHVASSAADCANFRSRLDELLDRLKSPMKDWVDKEASEENPFIKVLPNSPSVERHDVSLIGFFDWCRERHLPTDNLMKSGVSEIGAVIGGCIDEKYRSHEPTIDDLLKDEQNRRIIDSEDLLNYLSQAAAPLWHYSKSEVPLDRDSINNISYCSVPNSESSTVKNLKGGWRGVAAPELVSSIDQHRITFLNITYGVPLFALADLKVLKEEYAKKGRATCHLHRDWRNLPDLFPAQPDGPLICFTLAQVPGFDLIKKNGNGSYAIYVDPQKPKELAIELEESFNRFTAHPEGFEEVRRAVTSRLNAQPRLEVKNSLEEFKKKLRRATGSNGQRHSSKSFTERQVKAIEEYLKDF